MSNMLSEPRATFAQYVEYLRNRGRLVEVGRCGSYKYKFGASEVTICRHVKSSPLLMLGRKVAKSCFRLSKRIACSLSSKT